VRPIHSGLTLILSLCLMIFAPAIPSLAEDEEPPKILGRCTSKDLKAEPFAEWFVTGRESYVPDSRILERLRGVDLDDLEVEIFFGTWCGDSRREVPRLVKLLDEIGLPVERVGLIGVDGVEQMHKRSPGGEEEGLEIYRVPTVIVRRGGREVGRIVEYPVLSLERDLLAILDGTDYEPSYRSYPTVRRWLDDGFLADPNVSPRGLADSVRQRVSGEGELAAAARVLMTRGEVDEAAKLYQINAVLFRESSRSWARLGEAWLRAGDPEQALASAERALRLNRDPDEIEGLLDLVQRARPTPRARS
jgi:hypothetical protein